MTKLKPSENTTLNLPLFFLATKSIIFVQRNNFPWCVTQFTDLLDLRKRGIEISNFKSVILPVFQQTISERNQLKDPKVVM